MAYETSDQKIQIRIADAMERIASALESRNLPSAYKQSNNPDAQSYKFMPDAPPTFDPNLGNLSIVPAVVDNRERIDENFVPSNFLSRLIEGEPDGTI